MVSPVQVPPPRYRRPLSGPVVLIALGVLFLLGTMGVLDWRHLGHWFANYWPLLLIVWGVLKLIEYQQAQRQGTRASGIGAGGVFLVISIIIFGLIATHASRFHWDQLRDQIVVVLTDGVAGVVPGVEAHTGSRRLVEARQRAR